MKIAVLSGKGGTGKTFVSVNLAAVSGPVTYLDCDVEEPNGALFLKPLRETTDVVHVMLPEVNESKCNGCRICVDFCKFSALAYVKEHLRIFPELCHGCEGCLLLCPQEALKKVYRPVGRIVSGEAGAVRVCTGILDVGQVTGVPIIRQMMGALSESEEAVIDCPPGSSCVVMESIREADYCLLVGESTAFGIHNLQMVHKLVKLFGKPHGLVINKHMGSGSSLESYCEEGEIPIIAKIPYDIQAGKLLASGKILAEVNPGYEALFKDLRLRVEKEVRDAATGHPER